MNEIAPGLSRIGMQDWDRRRFDELVPLPDGTSYNAYLLQTPAGTVLFDTNDPKFRDPFLRALEGTPRIDFVVSHHAEQDHSGLLPDVLALHPAAQVLCTARGKTMLGELLPDLPADRVRAVEDGETLALGDRTLRFVHLPWVHWPETMATLIEPDGILISGDFFGSHLASSALYASQDERTLPAAKLYFAQIMMPYASVVKKDLEKVKALNPRMLAPTHGPVYDRPEEVLAAHDRWLNAPPENLVVIAGVSMHGSTRAMADALTESLVRRGVAVRYFDLVDFAVDRFAVALVDAATLVFAASAVWNGPHPAAQHAMMMAAGFKPKARHAALIGSYGWGANALANLGERLPGLKLEILPPVLARGAPRSAQFEELDRLAALIAEKHQALAGGAAPPSSPA
jgi:flavorubredoxin